jgi:hypothetical protein
MATAKKKKGVASALAAPVPSFGLHIESGDNYTKDVKIVPGQSVRFVRQDGTTMFRVQAEANGRHIRITAVNSTFIDGKWHQTELKIMPLVSNVVVIGTMRQGEWAE